MMTFVAPPLSMWTRALLASVQSPVDSTTTSTPRSFHRRSAGSLWLRNLTSCPSTWMVSPSALTAGPNVPSAVSCLSRWANVLASPMSLTATISKSGFRSEAARYMLRPMRPNPLIPTLTPMAEMLCGAEFVPRFASVTLIGGQLLQPSQAMVDRGLRELHPARELAEVQLRVLAPPLRHLAQRRRKSPELPLGLE